MRSRTPWMAASLLAAATAAHAQAGVTLFGIVDASVRRVATRGGPSVSQLANGGMLPSRLGVRGTEDLGGGRSAGFWLEASVAADTGEAGAAGGPFFNRRSIVTLAHRDWGELRLGRDYVPTFLAWAGQDPFGHTGVAFSGVFSGPPAATVRQAFGAAARPDVWTDNALQLLSPRFAGGFTAGLVLAPSENHAGTARRLRGVHLGYENGPIRLALARVDTRIAATGADFGDLAASGSYDFGVVRVSAALRRFGYQSSRQANLLLGATLPVGAGQLRAVVVRGNGSGLAGATDMEPLDGTLLGLGYVHRFSKRTAAYATVSRLANRPAATFALPGLPATAPGATSRGAEIGVTHTF